MTAQQRLILIIAILASGIAFLDGSIVSVGLPAIRQELGGGLALQQWVVDAYLITLGALILAAGSLSDLFGRKKVLLAGLLGFGVTSLACALAPSGELLIVARALQGAAGALLVPSSLALIMSAFSGAAQAKAIGTWTGWTGVAFIVGPLLGGALVDAGSWRLIFAINVIPIAATLWLLAKVKLAQSRLPDAHVDFAGAALGAIGLGGPVFALIEQPNYGWGHPLILLTLIGGLLSFSVFLWRERRLKYPMLPLDLFRLRNFGFGNLATVFVYGSLTAATFLLPVYLQQVAGYSALLAGLTLVPTTVIMLFLAPVFGGLSGRFGSRWFMAVGPVIVAGGLLVMAGFGSQVDFWRHVLPAVVLFGIGLSVTVAPLTSAVLGCVNSERGGVASAINNAIARVAGLLAIAALGAFAAAQFSGNVTAELQRRNLELSAANQETVASVPFQVEPPEGLTEAPANDVSAAQTDASVSTFRSSILVTAGVAVLGGVVSAIWIQNQPPRSKTFIKATPK